VEEEEEEEEGCSSCRLYGALMPSRYSTCAFRRDFHCTTFVCCCPFAPPAAVACGGAPVDLVLWGAGPPRSHPRVIRTSETAMALYACPLLAARPAAKRRRRLADSSQRESHASKRRLPGGSGHMESALGPRFEEYTRFRDLKQVVVTVSL
jgi:hypothetical protein